MFKRSREQDSFTSNQEHAYIETDNSPKKWFGFSLKRKSGVSSDEVGQRAHPSNDPEFFRREYYKQELDIQDLQQQLLARDADYEDLQQQWNLQNFKFCLLVDMRAVRVLDNEELARQADASLRSGTGRTTKLIK
ncbi:hypothetical protein WJX79_003649 [Trebouxia sp. C0005]